MVVCSACLTHVKVCFSLRHLPGYFARVTILRALKNLANIFAGQIFPLFALTNPLTSHGKQKYGSISPPAQPSPSASHSPVATPSRMWVTTINNFIETSTSMYGSVSMVRA